MTHIIFMGTPEFSVPILRALAGRPDYRVSMVITQPDRPRGRGRHPAASPVKQAALSLGLPVFQPSAINTPEVERSLTALKPDYFVVVAYGRLLSQALLDIPRIYPINIHASLLPRYRGPSPIHAAVRNRDPVSGVTTIVMNKDMDAGDILMSAATPLSPHDTAQDLHDRLANLGASLILDTIDRVNGNTLIPRPQNPDQASYVSLLRKQDGRVDWTRPAPQVVAHVLAMYPWPGAFCYLQEKYIKIFRTTALETPADALPGTVVHCDDQGIHVAAGMGRVIIRELMGASGKRMAATAFLRGHAIAPGDWFD